MNRRVEFAPPGEPPNIYWMHGRVDAGKFAAIHGVMGGSVKPSQVKYGWASRKMDGICIYLSDVPLENFEPITYFIPSDQERETIP